VTSASLSAPSLRHGVRVAVAMVLGTAATGAILALGLRIATAATADPTFLAPSGRRTGYPSWMRGPLQGYATSLTLHAFVAVMAAMVVAWLAVLLCARSIPTWFLVGAVVAATAIFALAPPLLSTDVFNYIAYGQMGTHGINPYLHGPIVLQNTPLYGYTGHLWKDVASAYGPLFTLITYALAPLGVAGAFWALKAIMALSLLGIAAFVWAAARRLGLEPRFAVALVALNPLVLVYAVGGAHNDLLMALPLAAALYLTVTKRPAAAGAAVVGAIAIKASAGLALPFVLLGADRRWRAAAGALAAAVVMSAVAYLAFGTAITHMLGALAVQEKFHWIVTSVPSFVSYYLGYGHPDRLARQIFTVSAVVVLVVMLARARGGRGWIEGAAGATLALLATTAWVLPWYVVWALPFVALVRSRTLPLAAAVLTALLMAMQLDHFLLTHASHRVHTPTAYERRLARERERARAERQARLSEGRVALRHVNSRG
jgi:hypothetical protein